MRRLIALPAFDRLHLADRGLRKPEPSRAAAGPHTVWVGFGPLFIAREQGFFAREGIEVELIRIEDHTTTYAGLSSGQIDAVAAALQATEPSGLDGRETGRRAARTHQAPANRAGSTRRSTQRQNRLRSPVEWYSICGADVREEVGERWVTATWKPNCEGRGSPLRLAGPSGKT
jgi:hypothetical protein